MPRSGDVVDVDVGVGVGVDGVLAVSGASGASVKRGEHRQTKPAICIMIDSGPDESSIRVMPTVLRIGPYRFYFYSHDLVAEPPDIHVDRDDLSAKFWLVPVALARNLGFGAPELRRVERLVAGRQADFIERWYEDYGRTSG